MKRKVTAIAEEFDNEGNIINKTTETVREKDNGFIYPQHSIYPWCPSEGNPLSPSNKIINTDGI